MRIWLLTLMLIAVIALLEGPRLFRKPSQTPTVASRGIRTLRLAGRVVGLCIVAVLAMLLLEGCMVYHPMRLPADAEVAPPGVEDCTIRTADGLDINAWWLPPREPETGPVLLWFHGNAGNLVHRAQNLALLRRGGLGVLAVDYRGYGKSQGRPSEDGLYLDGEAAYRHLVRERGVAPGRIVCFGRSLGTAVALHVALKERVGGVILESPLSNARAMARRTIPLLPIWLFMRSRFDNEGRVRELRVPLLVLHGDRDEVIPFKQGRAVFEAAPEPKEFYTIRGAGHNDTYVAGGADYFEKFFDFCRSCVQREG